LSTICLLAPIVIIITTTTTTTTTYYESLARLFGGLPLVELAAAPIALMMGKNRLGAFWISCLKEGWSHTASALPST